MRFVCYELIGFGHHVSVVRDWVYQIMKEFDKKKDKTKMPTAEFNNPIKKEQSIYEKNPLFKSEEVLTIESRNCFVINEKKCM